MTVEEFEEKYRSKGGIEMLTKMRSLLYTRKYIADHFGVTSDMVRQWMKQFFGCQYDPRPDRKEIIIANMVEFANNNPKELFDVAFKKTQYYKEALSICKEQEIYGVK